MHHPFIFLQIQDEWLINLNTIYTNVIYIVTSSSDTITVHFPKVPYLIWELRKKQFKTDNPVWLDGLQIVAVLSHPEVNITILEVDAPVQAG